MEFVDIENNCYNFVINLLDDENINLLDDFSCGNDVLDEKFRKDCTYNPSFVTSLVINNSTKEIVCVYSINCASLILESHGKHYPTPAVEIKYFAMNIKYQDIKAFDEEGCLSNIILYDLIAQIFSFTDNICGANYVFLYSTPEGEPFYRKCGFIDFPKDAWNSDSSFLEGCIPLYLKLR